MTIKRIESILYRAANQPEPPHYRSLAERFAIPHVFSPDLSVRHALISVAGALARILLGSLLFAFWGTGAALVWSALPNILLLRIAVLVPMVIVFLTALTGLMLAISAAEQRVHPAPLKN